jgi:hypothetical protein
VSNAGDRSEEELDQLLALALAAPLRPRHERQLAESVGW